MTKQTRGSNRNGRRGDPNQDVQPWLGWIAAMFVVVIVVIAVAMGMERTGQQRNGTAEVRMTPLVGGMEVPVATGTGEPVAASEVTPLPQAISETAPMTMVTVITATDAVTGALSETDTFTATGEMTPTENLTLTTEITDTTALTLTAEATEVATAEATVVATPTAALTITPTITPTIEATPTVEATAVITVEATAEATVAATPTPRPTATPRPTVVMRVFKPGDIVVATAGRVEVHADASQESMVLDTFGAGVTLEVLDVSGDFESYPVEAEGHGWARVRAGDGLVGWVMTDQVEVE